MIIIDSKLLHENALLIEELMRKEFSAERFSLGGSINSDYIAQKNNYWHCFLITVSPYYRTGSLDDKSKIENFFSKYNNYSSKDLNDIEQEKFKLLFKKFIELLNYLKHN